MNSLKTWCLLSLSVLLLLSLAPTETKVVQSMSQCGEFLLGEKPPNVPDILENGRILKPKRYKIICQTYKDTSRFVTLYDTNNKIPILSAYKYTGRDGTKVDCSYWNIEPQLEEPKSDINMKDCYVTYNNQASDKDYQDDPRYEKGHLLPKSYGFDGDARISTCTLTNAVPQVVSFNKGRWAKMESCVRCILQYVCIDNNKVPKGYVVTGARPGKNKLNNRVTVPSMLWSAFCCQTQNGWLASAFWENNVKNNKTFIHTRTLTELYDKLSKGQKKFDAFPGTTNCPLEGTVAHLYPQMNVLDKKCSCPPPVRAG